jgi:hypothetical protein
MLKNQNFLYFFIFSHSIASLKLFRKKSKVYCLFHLLGIETDSDRPDPDRFAPGCQSRSGSGSGKMMRIRPAIRIQNIDIEYCVPEFLCCRMNWGQRPPPPQACVGELYFQGLKRQSGGAISHGKGGGGTQGIRQHRTLVLHILHSIYVSQSPFKFGPLRALGISKNRIRKIRNKMSTLLKGESF